MYPVSAITTVHCSVPLKVDPQEQLLGFPCFPFFSGFFGGRGRGKGWHVSTLAGFLVRGHMRKSSVRPNVRTYNSAIRSCENGPWQVALDLFGRRVIASCCIGKSFSPACSSLIFRDPEKAGHWRIILFNQERRQEGPCFCRPLEDQG